VLYTDSNGLDMMERTYSSDYDEPVAANFYPMVQRAFIRDAAVGAQLSLLSKQSHGVASLKPGQLEVMLHRRCLDDE